MNAAPLAAANRRFSKIVRSSIGAAARRSTSDERREEDTTATIRLPIVSGSSQPEIPPRETPSTRPVSPAT